MALSSSFVCDCVLFLDQRRIAGQIRVEIKIFRNVSPTPYNAQILGVGRAWLAVY